MNLLEVERMTMMTIMIMMIIRLGELI